MSGEALTRKAIRQDATARLAGATIAGDRIYGFRLTRIPPEKLPALLVYLKDGDGKNTSIGCPKLAWDLSLSVECVVDATSDENLADELDDLAQAVEDRLMHDPEWVAQFSQVVSIRYEADGDASGSTRVGVARLTFNLKTATLYPPKLDDVPGLSTVELEVDTIPVDGSREAAATLTLE